ncbi:MAG: class A beta-lactamase [Gammaproteobacteria bacterium]|nr:class A beta-lactamase [Gammaproteobacteria bacterium]
MRFRHVFASLLMFVSLDTFAENSQNFNQSIAALEKENGGRLGVSALNLENGQRLEYRADERFALASTFKLLLVAAVLHQVDLGKETLTRPVIFTSADIQSYAPITSQHVKDGQMSIAALCAAALQYSDNTAANLLLKTIGGPAGLTRYIHTLGDHTTRLDRNEPTLNTNIAHDVRDTTTPASMLKLMQVVLVGKVLSPNSKAQLANWLMGNTTGDAKLRAGLNPMWKVGDKTGSGANGASNDVAIVWPESHQPFLVTVYYTDSTISVEQQSRVIAQVGTIVGKTFYSY